MSEPKILPRYSVGVGDRFAQEASAQLSAFILAAKVGIDVTPVWNKSNREHTIIGSDPAHTRKAVESAVAALQWRGPFYCDADHINLTTVDRFLDPCDFFTIDVADLIDKHTNPDLIRAFTARHPELVGSFEIEGVGHFTISNDFLETTAGKYVGAVEHAAAIYAKIEGVKGKGTFVTEISMDETDEPQTPVELLIILAAISDFAIPIQTIAPKFTGRFNKGVDYVGDVAQFQREFANDIKVIEHAVTHYGLPGNLKLSVHSGSDKFSIYGPLNQVLRETGAGLHLKTAGTTWLEELIGLAEAGGDGLDMAKEIYTGAFAHREELCAPYATVIDIDPARLPAPETVNIWSSDQFTAALRHDPTNPQYNSSLRQLLHVGFKVAAKLNGRYLNLLRVHQSVVARNVTDNLYNRHIVPIFKDLD